MPIRIREGVFKVVSELSKKLDIDKLDVTTMLVFSGLMHIDPKMYSSDALELVWADAVESYVELVRALSYQTPEHREKLLKPMRELYDQLSELFQKPKGER